MNTMLFEFVRI